MTWLVSHPVQGRPVTHAFPDEAAAERAAELLVRRGGTAVVWEMDEPVVARERRATGAQSDERGASGPRCQQTANEAQEAAR